MSDETAGADKKPPLRSVKAGREQKIDKRSPAHIFGEMRHSPEKIRELFRTGQYPYKTKIRNAVYEQHKKELQVELLKVQNWVKQTGQKIIVICEGRDAAGKGGTIKRYMEHLNPRAARVVALEKPTEHELGQWYFQRYIKHLPDRWRDGVLRSLLVQPRRRRASYGFCSSLDYLEFMRQVPDLERMLVRSGIQMFKYWFSVTHAEQERRFDSRQGDPLKQWKLSPIDELSRDKWAEYTEAKEAMFFYTDTADCAVDRDQVRRQETRASELHAALPGPPRLSRQGRARRARS